MKDYNKEFERRRKISKALKGKSKSLEHIQKVANSNRGQKRNFEQKERMRLSHLGKRQSKETRDKRRKSLIGREHWWGNKISKSKKGYQHSEETKRKMRQSHLKDGLTPLNKLLRKSSMFKIWREAVFLRDNFTCQNKDCKYCDNKIGVLLHPHHIQSFAEYPAFRFNIHNGITYCAEFHINSKTLHKNIKRMEIKKGVMN